MEVGATKDKICNPIRNDKGQGNLLILLQRDSWYNNYDMWTQEMK